MNHNINIAEILKDYPKGTKLYSPLLGNVTLEEINTISIVPIRVIDSLNSCSCFTKTGLYYDRADGECLLFPSKEMRDWSKFFKRGDVLTNGDIIVLFEEWVDSSRRYFKTSLIIGNSINKVYTKETTYNVKYFQLAPKPQQEYFIKKIEAFYDGKYNPITLQVESIKSKCEFKPFDKVLVRDNSDEKWTISMFSYYDQEDDIFPYVCVGNRYYQCIPYNDQTTHLIGTKKTYNQ